MYDLSQVEVLTINMRRSSMSHVQYQYEYGQYESSIHIYE